MLGERADPRAILNNARNRINGDARGNQQENLFSRPEPAGESDAPSGADGAERAPEVGTAPRSGQDGSGSAQSEGLTPSELFDKLFAELPDDDAQAKTVIDPDTSTPRMKIAAAYLDRFRAGSAPDNIIAARKLAEETLGEKISDKALEEGIEAGIVLAVRSVVADQAKE